jgi:hypothetical protein
MSGARHRRKGTRIERELVDRHKALGIHAERYPLSGASHFRGSGHDIDVYALGRDKTPLVAEVKARANGAGFGTLEKWAGRLRCAFPSAQRRRAACPRPVAYLGPYPQRGPAMTILPDLFAAPSDRHRHLAGAPADPLRGLAVQLSDRCQCGSYDAVIGEGRGPYRASLFCSRCERNRGWMGNEAHAFVTQVVEKFGKPTTPIAIRRNRTNREGTVKT